MNTENPWNHPATWLIAIVTLATNILAAMLANGAIQRDSKAGLICAAVLAGISGMSALGFGMSSHDLQKARINADSAVTVPPPAAASQSVKP